MKNWSIALLLGVVPGVPIVAQSSRPVIAVLESAPCHKGEPAWKGEPARSVRPLFGMTATGWTALTTADASRPFDLRDVTWTVAFDGRSLGPVRTIDPGFSTTAEWTRPRDRLLRVQSTPRPPVVASVKGMFDGWCASASSRPLVLVTPANVEDPDRWKPFRPTPAVRDRLVADFRKAVGMMLPCPEFANESMPFDHVAVNFATVKGYQDRAGRMLVALQVDDENHECDSPEGPRATQWFLLSDGVHPLGPNFELVDAGDYDRDGKSDILFWYSGYNNDGYTLLHDGLAKHTDFRWHYH